MPNYCAVLGCNNNSYKPECRCVSFQNLHNGVSEYSRIFVARTSMMPKGNIQQTLPWNSIKRKPQQTKCIPIWLFVETQLLENMVWGCARIFSITFILSSILNFQLPFMLGILCWLTEKQYDAIPEEGNIIFVWPPLPLEELLLMMHANWITTHVHTLTNGTNTSIQLPLKNGLDLGNVQCTL